MNKGEREREREREKEGGGEIVKILLLTNYYDLIIIIL